jgi:hypothetical protein
MPFSAALLAALFFLAPLKAHEIPNDVTLQVFFKPEGSHLRMLVRCPLTAMRDINFPERGPGYLDLEKVDPMLNEAATLWISDFVELYEGDARLTKHPEVISTRLSYQSDKSFTSYESALARVMGPKLPADVNVFWNQVFLDVLFEYPIQSAHSEFSLRSTLARLGLRTVTVLRFVRPDGGIRAFEFTGNPGLLRIDPRWYQAALRFVDLGFLHILDGIDHLLFLFALVLPVRKFRALVPVVTSFTVAHSITLIGSAYDLAPGQLWFPPLIETLIATSIVYMALENIVGTSSVHHRWMIAFGFGLVHGFGFSFALRETLQFAGSHLLTSLLSFNIGVELGQLLVLVLMIPALELLFRFAVPERVGTLILSALVAHTGWHWMVERWGVLSRYRFEWPAITAASLSVAMRWLMVIVFIAAVVWFIRTFIRRQPTSE